ncbi:hypothetical protein IQ06DRAFT_65561 [Phaeosphaeriaceae sp. SRC1lsM3a]|nr:hypothetical protein IQ06DRAFT_65561 [Stagonospora sp. SRC1lsM3a]
MNQLPLESFLALSSLMELLLLPYDKSVSVAFQSERIFWRLRSWFHRSDPPIECDYHTSDNGELRNLAMTQRKYLFLGAKPHPRRVHLRQLLKHLLLLECEDPRDRIYGIRSLIAWSRDKAPIPDYNKDAFLLATEVVESLHCDKPSQNFYWHQTSMTYLIRDLSRALFVSCNSAAFESALHCRRRDAKVRDESLARIPIRRVGDIRWVGMKACDLFHMTPRESYMELCLLDDNEGRPSFFAPKDTQPDDYILTCEPSYKWSNPTVEYYEDQILRQVPFKDRVLVLRASYNSDRYHVLGAAYETTPLDDIFVERIDWKHFIIWWDAEDLLVHDWRVAQYDMNKGMDRQVDVCFGGRFSAFEGSTYAMGPFEPEVIKAKLDTDPDIAFLEPE